MMITNEWKRCFVLAAIATTSFAALPWTAVAQSRPFWRGLEPGPYAVGFQVIRHLDRSRQWDALPDSSMSRDLGRPIRISIWYPARVSASARPMPYRVYFSPPRSRERIFARADSLLEYADVSTTRDAIFRRDAVLFNRLLASPTAAHLDAPAAKGRFPLIAYSEGYNNRSHDNSVLAEYLASHGFVVLTVPQLGTRSTRLILSIDERDLETQTRDLEVAIGEARSLPFVDAKRLGLMGYSMGGIVALRAAGRIPNVRGVAGLDPSIRAPRFVSLVTASTDIAPRLLRMPILSLQSGNASEASAQDTTVMHLLRFSDRSVGLVGNAMHGDFSDFSAYAPLFPLDVQGRTVAEAHDAHTAISRYVLAFFRGALLGDNAATTFATRSSEENGLARRLVRMQRWPGIRAPSEEELAALVLASGVDRALGAYRVAAARYRGADLLDQRTINRFGYGQLERGRPRDAVGLFRLNAEAHPASADVWDSLAEGLIAAGDRVGAKQAYQQLLVVLPADATLDAAAKDEYRRSTEEKIRGLP